MSPDLFFTNGIVTVFINSDVETRAFVHMANYSPLCHHNIMMKEQYFNQMTTIKTGEGLK